MRYGRLCAITASARKRFEMGEVVKQTNALFVRIDMHNKEIFFDISS